MRNRIRHWMLISVLSALGVACLDSAAPDGVSDTGLVVPGTPDLTVVVFQSTHEEFNAPDGYHHSQYAIWVGGAGALNPDAGVVVGAGGPVFIRSAGELTRTTAAVITAGDTIQVWRSTSVSYGAAQAPPGAPCYEGLQIVIVR
jgi:hypothetical protein